MECGQVVLAWPDGRGLAGKKLIALAAAYAIAVIATPAGISGAVLLLPFQVSVLGTPSPAVTPTNLLYNVVATPEPVPVPQAAPDRGTPRRPAHHGHLAR